MTEAWKWPNLEWPNLEKDQTSKVTEPRMTEPRKWPNLERPNLELDRTSNGTEPRKWSTVFNLINLNVRRLIHYEEYKKSARNKPKSASIMNFQQNLEKARPSHASVCISLPFWNNMEDKDITYVPNRKGGQNLKDREETEREKEKGTLFD